MKNKRLGREEWSLSFLEKIEENSEYVHVGDYYSGANFLIRAIKRYGQVYLPIKYTLGSGTTKGIEHNELYEGNNNPYVPHNELVYVVNIVKKDNRYGMIDSSGAVILSPVFTEIVCANRICDPYFIIKKEGCAFMYDVMKFRVTSPFYDEIKVVCQRSISSKSTDHYFKANKNCKCGLIHETRKQILPPVFDDCYGLCWYGTSSNNPESRFAIVTKNGEKGLYNELNELGKEVLPIKYDSMRFAYPEICYAKNNIEEKNIRVLGREVDSNEEDLIDYHIDHGKKSSEFTKMVKEVKGESILHLRKG